MAWNPDTTSGRSRASQITGPMPPTGWLSTRSCSSRLRTWNLARGPVEEAARWPQALPGSAGRCPSVGEVCHPEFRVWGQGQEGRGPSLCQAVQPHCRCPRDPTCSTAGSAGVSVCPHGPTLLTSESGHGRALQGLKQQSPACTRVHAHTHACTQAHP